ncbi:hypothetical protein BCR35DRAFT_310486 [Leucosporidium creatinivorum]|uniref:Ribosomal protein S15 n=1 Tax=Leucosporidium creatinivorum TaxID=106004 RepID=A0A1Y2D4G5_9BASI|nr:hypothetical protein BCR35DRAFT_310486 [Leucosporidium creatinivorum]
MLAPNPVSLCVSSVASSSSLLVPCSSSAASFSSSAISNETKAKRKSRLTKKAHMDRKASLVRQHEQTKPDAILGYPRSSPSAAETNAWDTSLLKSVLLDRNEIWARTTGGSAQDQQQFLSGLPGSNSSYLPKHYNFGLNADTASLLTETLPAVSSMRSILGSDISNDTIRETRVEIAEKEEMEKRQRLLRIMDLRNAGAKGIEVENTRRIVEAFGRKEGDTGSPEVQAAILTSRIHSLTTHLISQPRDIHNRRPLRSLIHQRAKVLKYLRSVNVLRYEECLAKIGVQSRAVEGEVVVTKQGLRELIRGV